MLLDEVKFGLYCFVYRNGNGSHWFITIVSVSVVVIYRLRKKREVGRFDGDYKESFSNSSISLSRI